MNFFNEKQLLTHQQGIYGLESGLRAGARYSFGSGLELGVDMDYGVSKVFDDALNDDAHQASAAVVLGYRF